MTKVTNVFALLVILRYTSARGQQIEPLILCENRTETVNSPGIIEHIQSSGTPSTSCTLVLKGFSIGSHLSLLGVEQRTGDCEDNTPVVLINGYRYCVKSTYSQTILPLTDTKLTISLSDSAASSFVLQYYSTVVVCGEDISLAGAEVDGVSGIISSSDNPRLHVRLSECTSAITNLHFGAVIFELLHHQLADDRLSITNGAEFSLKPRDPILITTGEKQISVTYVPDLDEGMQHVSFVIKYTVLTCGDFPEVAETVAHPPSTLWFPGSVVNYTCSEDHYMINGVSTTECEMDVEWQVAEWTDVSSIKCTPVPSCALSPDDVANANYTKIDNHTVTYQCKTGYRSEYDRTDVRAVCSTTDPSTTPWTWNSTDVQLVCTKVECETPDITNGSVISGGETGTHYYLDILDYKCSSGYRKSVEEDITCESDGGWSNIVSCIEGGDTAPDMADIKSWTVSIMVIIILSPAAFVVVVTMAAILVWKCGKSNSAPKKRRQSLTDNSSSAGVKATDVELDLLKPKSSKSKKASDKNGGIDQEVSNSPNPSDIHVYAEIGSSRQSQFTEDVSPPDEPVYEEPPELPPKLDEVATSCQTQFTADVSPPDETVYEEPLELSPKLDEIGTSHQSQFTEDVSPPDEHVYEEPPELPPKLDEVATSRQSQFTEDVNSPGESVWEESSTSPPKLDEVAPIKYSLYESSLYSLFFLISLGVRISPLSRFIEIIPAVDHRSRFKIKPRVLYTGSATSSRTEPDVEMCDNDLYDIN